MSTSGLYFVSLLLKSSTISEIILKFTEPGDSFIKINKKVFSFLYLMIYGYAFYRVYRNYYQTQLMQYDPKLLLLYLETYIKKLRRHKS